MNKDELQQIAELEQRLTVTAQDLANTLRVLDNAKGTANFRASTHRQQFKRTGYALDWDANQHYKDHANKIAEVIEIVKEQNQ